ncbi:hypothetical protein G9A89_013270 [Geosiphon pyriformis]|nr:hypothetical protein G9A89_013270 [Geosiphon pyriformis]
MKKSKKKLFAGSAIINSFTRKKYKGELLKESVKVIGVSASDTSEDLTEHKTENTTKLESMDMEEEYLIKKTSFQLGNKKESSSDSTDMTPKDPKKMVIKCTLGKPLSVIDFNKEEDDNNDILDKFVLLLPYLLATFTSEKTLIAVIILTSGHGVIVNTNFKCPVNNHTNWAIVLKKIPVGTSVKAVRVAVSEFEKIKAIRMQLSIFIRKNVVCMARTDIDKQTWNAKDNYKVLLYTLPIRTTAHNLWDFIGSVSGKTCVIDCNPVNYTHVYCAIVCFNSELKLVKALAVTPIIKGVGLTFHWLCVWSLVKVELILRGRKAPLSAQNWFKLASMVGTLSASSLRGVYFSPGSIKDGKSLPSGADDLEKQLVNIKSSLTSLMEQISKLAKRLDSLMLAVFQSSPGCQLLVTPSSQNSEGDIVIGVGSNETTGNETAMIIDSSVFSHVIKLENMLEDLSVSVLSLSACFDDLVLVGGAIPQPSSQ